MKSYLFVVANYVFYICYMASTRQSDKKKRSCSKKITLPGFTDRMEKLKELDKFELLSSLLKKDQIIEGL